MTGPLRYRGFISYASADRKAAKRLFRELERYRLPRGILIGAVEDNLKLERRLGRFFFDREEVRASTNVRGELDRHLDAAQNLIVICSPNAIDSPWVNYEVAHFRDHHPDRPIFGYIVAGDPGLGAAAGGCLPGSLADARDRSGGPPLAADIRAARRSSARRREAIRLIAAFCNLEFDELWRRWTKRRRRRLILQGFAGLAVLASLWVGLSAWRESQATHLLAIAEEASAPEVRIAAALAVLPAEGALLPVSQDTQDRARNILLRETYSDTPDLVFGTPSFGPDDTVEIAISADGRTVYGRSRIVQVAGMGPAPMRPVRIAWDARTLAMRRVRSEARLEPDRYFQSLRIRHPEFGDLPYLRAYQQLGDAELAAEIAALDPTYFGYDPVSRDFAFLNYRGVGVSNLDRPRTTGVIFGNDAGDIRPMMPVFGPDGRLRFYDRRAEQVEEWDAGRLRRFRLIRGDRACVAPHTLMWSHPFILRIKNGRACMFDLRTGVQTQLAGLDAAAAPIRWVEAEPGRSGYLSLSLPAANFAAPRQVFLSISPAAAEIGCRGEGAAVAASPTGGWVVTMHLAPGSPGVVPSFEYRLRRGCASESVLLQRSRADRSRAFAFHPRTGALYWIDGGLRRIDPAQASGWAPEPDRSVRMLAIDRSGEFVVSLKGDGSLTAFPLGSGRPRAFARAGVLALFPGRLSGEFLVIGRDRIVEWNPATAARREQRLSLGRPPLAVAVGSDSRTVAVVAADGWIQTARPGRELGTPFRQPQLGRLLDIPNAELTGIGLGSDLQRISVSLRVTENPGVPYPIRRSYVVSIPLPGGAARLVQLPSAESVLLPIRNNESEVAVLGGGALTMLDGETLVHHRSLVGWSDPPLFAGSRVPAWVARPIAADEGERAFRSIGVFDDRSALLYFAVAGGAPPTALAMDESARFLAVGGRDGVVRVWRLPRHRLSRAGFCSPAFNAVRAWSLGGRDPNDHSMGLISARSEHNLSGFELCPCRERGPLSLQPARWPLYQRIRSWWRWGSDGAPLQAACLND